MVTKSHNISGNQGICNDMIFGNFCKLLFLCDMTILPSTWFFMVFLGHGMIGIVPSIFWYDFCEIVIFGGYKNFIVDFNQYLLIYTSNDKMNYENRSGTSILGC